MILLRRGELLWVAGCGEGRARGLQGTGWRACSGAGFGRIRCPWRCGSSAGSGALHGRDVRAGLADLLIVTVRRGERLVSGGHDAENHAASDDAPCDECHLLEVLAETGAALARCALDAQDVLLTGCSAIHVLRKQAAVGFWDVGLLGVGHHGLRSACPPVGVHPLVMAGDAARVFADADNQLELLRQAVDDKVAVHQTTVHQFGRPVAGVEYGGRIGVFHRLRHLQIGMTSPGEDAHGQQAGIIPTVFWFAAEIKVQAGRIDIPQRSHHGLLLGFFFGSLGRPLLGRLLFHIDDQLLRIVEPDLRHIVVRIANQGHVVHPARIRGDGQIGRQASCGGFDDDHRRLAGIGGLHQPAHAVANGQVGDVFARQQVDDADVQRRAGDGGLTLAVGIHHHAVGANHAGRAAGVEPGLRGRRGGPPGQRNRRFAVVDLVAGLQRLGKAGFEVALRLRCSRRWHASLGGGRSGGKGQGQQGLGGAHEDPPGSA